MFNDFNTFVLVYLNWLSDNEIIKNIALILADLPIFFLPLFLIIWWIIFTFKNKENKKDNLLLIFYSICTWVLINYIVKFFVDVERPETVLESKWNLILEHVPDKSFPSDHSTVTFAFLSSLYLFGFKKTFAIFLPFWILMNLSRIIAWVHWPLDIIAWIIIWITSALIISKFQNQLNKISNILKKLDFVLYIKKLIIK